MKKLFLLISIIGVTALLSSCSKVPAGNVGIKFYLLGASKGVDYEQLSPGRYWIGVNEELYLFPTFTQNQVWTKNENEGSENDESITFQTREGMSVNTDIGITYHLIPEKVPYVFETYKRGIDEITDIFLRNIVRDAFVQYASERKVESVYGAGKSELINKVDSMVKERVQPLGIIIDQIYLIGEMRLPQQVVIALNRKIEATQRAQQRENELREAQAEAQKKIAQAQGEAESVIIKAKSQAEANTLLSRSLTPSLVEYEKIKKWDGKLSQVQGSGGSLVSIK